MSTGANRILTTHTGSLPRPDDLIQIMWAKGDGIPVDEAALARRVATAVHEVVDRQIAAGIDVVNDGEMSKPSYATYVKDRLHGFGGESIQDYFFEDLVDFPRSAELVSANPDAVAGKGAHGSFSSAASPGVVSLFFANTCYPTDEEYVFAIAEAMRPGYEAIAATRAAVQLDCPDLSMGRDSAYAGMDLDAFRRRAGMHIEALNHAVRNIPAEQLRMHLCWGNYPGPHHRDIRLADVIDLVWKASPSTVLVEAANPRHAHEWRLFEEIVVPDGKVVCPGVIEPQSNYIEHPELVAQRIEQYARIIGRERVLAGVDCGFSVHVGMQGIDRDVAWAKFEALAQGAEIATGRLWS